MFSNLFGGIFDSSTVTVIPVYQFLLCVVVSLLLGIVLAAAYTYKSKYNAGFVRTLAILPAVVCIVIMMVNGNVGTGVAVAGAFSLVRFRSVPGSAKEIGAIFIAMGAGLVSGMGYLGYAVLYTVILSLVMALYVQIRAWEKNAGSEKTMVITIPEDLDYTEVFDDLLEAYTSRYELTEVKTTNMGSLFKLTYQLSLKDTSKEKEMMRIIKEAVKKYESQIVNSKIKLSISSDTYLENIIDKIAGVYIDLSHEESHSFVLKDTLIQKYNLKTDGYSECLIAPMVDDEMLKDIISYTYNDNIDQSSYVLNNQVMPMLSSVNSVISTLENVFFYIGIGFAVFASIMFCNFIATSIANKKREIGILRAVGARGIDVLKIFLNESLMIAVINWILSVIACFAGVTLINQYIRNEFGVLVTILNFGLLQIVLLLMISIAVACIASAIPVYKISKKKPIDAIKDRK